jgi:RNA polymerase sigma-70 factor (ECF subfamily)
MPVLTAGTAFSRRSVSFEPSVLCSHPGRRHLSSGDTIRTKLFLIAEVVPFSLRLGNAVFGQKGISAMDSPSEITRLLERWSDGQQDAEGELMRLVVPEMRKLARRSLRNERQNHTLQPTALVNEAYMLLIDTKKVRWQDRSHFFALAARIMRNILVDYARRRLRSKREGLCVAFDESVHGSIGSSAEIVALNDALDEFAALDPRKAKVVELRFFGGMSVEETAAVLKISPNTVIRDWSLARAWLQRQISSGATTGI